ncbi:MAG TPA: hypothetical protein V6C88_10340 [Chroococcidiopsis sp.]
MIAIYRTAKSDRPVTHRQTEAEAIAWCQLNRLSDDWRQDYQIVPLISCSFSNPSTSNPSTTE